MVNWNLSFVADAVRVVAGNVDRQSNTIEIAHGGKPLYDKYRSLGLFGMDKRLQWAHIYGTSMEPEGVKDSSFIAFEPISVASSYAPTNGDVVLVEIAGEHNNSNLHGGFKLRKFVSICSKNPLFFNEISYDQLGKPHENQAALHLIRGKVLFKEA